MTRYVSKAGEFILHNLGDAYVEANPRWNTNALASLISRGCINFVFKGLGSKRALYFYATPLGRTMRGCCTGDYQSARADLVHAKRNGRKK